jgi:hypothetical protein
MEQLMMRTRITPNEAKVNEHKRSSSDSFGSMVFLIPEFIVHSDYRQEYPRIHADLLAVRLKHSA